MLSSEALNRISHISQDAVVAGVAVTSFDWMDKIGPWYTAFGMAGGGLLLILRLWIAWNELNGMRSKKTKQADDVDDIISED